jgi:hypothetical protein
MHHSGLPRFASECDAGFNPRQTRAAAACATIVRHLDTIEQGGIEHTLA